MIKLICNVGKSTYFRMELLVMGKKERFYADIMSMHQEVTGSCNIVTVRLPYGEKFHFVVDCGLFQETEYMNLNSQLPFKPKNIDFCLVTHAHVDHIGRLPFLVKNGFEGMIYTTDVTKSIMRPALTDSIKVLRSDAKKKKQPVIYDERDIENTIIKVRGCNYNTWISVREHVDVMFLSNGHLYGASMILVKISYPGERDINILFTGDYNNKNTFFKLEEIPSFVYSLPLTIVQEATYGYMNSSEIVKTFEDNIVKFMKTDGTALIPVFSLGRMQEILYILKTLQDEGKISNEIPVYVDGKLGMKYTYMATSGIFAIDEDKREFLPQNVIYVDKTIRGNIIKDNKPKIIVTTSGMGSHGPAQTYIPIYITRKNVLIHFTGYVTEGTLGRELKDTPKGEAVKIGGVLYRKQADVEYTNEFSGHAKADEIITFLKKFEKINLVLVNHGEFYSKDVLAERILDEIDPKNVGILGRYFYRISPYGLVTSKSTKFM